MHSLLLAACESRAGLDAAACSGANSLILDIAGATDKAHARKLAAAFLAPGRRSSTDQTLFAAVHALDDPELEIDLDALVHYAPDALILPRAASGADAQRFGAKIAVREAECGAAEGSVKIAAAVGGSGASLFKLGSFAGASRRLLALVWSPRDLAADLGCAPDFAAEPLRLGRSLVVAAAAAGSVPVYERSAATSDLDALRGLCARARRDGFAGVMVDRPDLVEVVAGA
jgi:citrate lyase subunit beta/citryl-CoA lyase